MFFTASWSPFEVHIVDDNLRLIFLSLVLLWALRCKLFLISSSAPCTNLAIEDFVNSKLGIRAFVLKKDQNLIERSVALLANHALRRQPTRSSSTNVRHQGLVLVVSFSFLLLTS
jgi:hypothetical protein